MVNALGREQGREVEDPMVDDFVAELHRQYGAKFGGAQLAGQDLLGARGLVSAFREQGFGAEALREDALAGLGRERIRFIMEQMGMDLQKVAKSFRDILDFDDLKYLADNRASFRVDKKMNNGKST